MIRIVSPKARIVVTEICLVTLEMFSAEKKFGLMTELRMIIAKRAI
jgi:hypothetical protein